MTAQNRTASAPESATADNTLVQTTPRPQRQRVRTIHYYWVDLGAVCQQLGLRVPYMCGRQSRRPLRTAGSDRIIDTVGALMAVTEQRDCKTCVRAYEAHLARQAAKT